MKFIRFKSTPENFRKEYSGLKCNTVRQCDDVSDVRFGILEDFIHNKSSVLKIIIINSVTGEDFVRDVTDVTFYDERYIISWRDRE